MAAPGKSNVLFLGALPVPIFRWTLALLLFGDGMATFAFWSARTHMITQIDRLQESVRLHGSDESVRQLLVEASAGAQHTMAWLQGGLYLTGALAVCLAGILVFHFAFRDNAFQFSLTRLFSWCIPGGEESAPRRAVANTRSSNTRSSNTKPSNTRSSNTKPSNTKPSNTKPSNSDGHHPRSSASTTAGQALAQPEPEAASPGHDALRGLVRDCASAMGPEWPDGTVSAALTSAHLHGITEAIRRELGAAHYDAAFYQSLRQEMRLQGRLSLDVQVPAHGGRPARVQRLVMTTSQYKNGRRHHYVALFIDVTKRRAHEALIWHQSRHDYLTRLPNRQHFHDRLDKYMIESRRGGSGFALVFLDLDDFKIVNDRLGHAVGDALLKLVALRLQRCVRSEDHVARLGGDEFMLVFHGIQEATALEPLCKKILSAAAAPYELSPDTVTVSASLGVCFFPQDGTDSVSLLKNADQAMYASKRKGRNQYCVYEEIKANVSVARADARTSLLHAEPVH